mgnify:CR=1 FL=1
MGKHKKNKPEIRFKGFTDDWEQRKLGEYLDVSNQKNQRGVYDKKDVLSVSGNFGIVNQIEFQGRSFAGVSVANYGVVETGDVVYTKSPLKSNPYGIIKANKGKAGIVSTLYAVYKPKDNADSTFIQTYFEQDTRMNNYMHPLVNKGAKNDMKVSAENALKGEVIFSKIEEQKQISVFFERLDNLITLHQRKLNNLKKVKKSMLEKMFPQNGEKEPQIRFCGFNSTWEQRKLGEVVERIVRKNLNMDSALPLTISAQYGLIAQSEFFDKRVASKDLSGYYLLYNGEFAYNKSTSVDAPWGAIKRLDRYEKGVLSTLYIVFAIRNLDIIDSNYLVTYYDNDVWYKDVSAIAAEGARNHGLLNIAPDDFFATTIKKPKSITEQKQIGEYFDKIDHLITLHQRKLKLQFFSLCLMIIYSVSVFLGVIFMGFAKEVDFEAAMIEALGRHGWEHEVLRYPTEDELIDNWARILFENNRDIDRLNDCPLIREEMDELLEQLRELRSPLAINSFINGRTVAITRKNPADTLHYGKEVSLKIYDRHEIAAGQSRYQIAQQPIFARKSHVLPDRRGDLMLLINGMPVFHIELKKSGVPVSEACNQIAKYSHERLFTGIFSLIQIFVAMNPEEAVYYANPGLDGSFNPDFYFHWADFNNEPINDWQKLVLTLLSIPMAHQLIGFYTVADSGDGILKVMRSYQYWAVNKIADRVAKNKWEHEIQRGGYIWHTTGSGKTMTSFKAAQLIADSKNADKVVFLMDRIELGTQSLKEYRAFADNEDDVQETEDTVALIGKLKSKNPKDTLIVSSIQKMSNIKEDAAGAMQTKDLDAIKAQRIVFILDECHRSTFGEMLSTIKLTFPQALFFGFSGTPVFTENEKARSTTADIFGDELHRYTIADGIRDKNVLGFDPVMVMVYKDKEIREQVALYEAKAATVSEVMEDEEKKRVFYNFMDKNAVPMAGKKTEDGRYIKGIEDYLPKSQYRTDKYQQSVVDDIIENWQTMSRDSKFHGIFAVSSIPEAVQYYRKFKKTQPDLKVTGLFDPTIDNEGGTKSLEKEDGLAEMLTDYNNLYAMQFDMSTYSFFKKDVAARLAHKQPYERVSREKQLDLLIVVNQMLTGFDSKWVNTLYLDKVLKYQDLIQAFSRTNRLYNINEKPFGTIKYYRYPHSMKQNIDNAVKLYSGDRPRGLFADHLPQNIANMNSKYLEMVDVFKQAGIPDLDRLPAETAAKAKFAKLFREFSTYYQASQIQGFSWAKKKYTYIADDGAKDEIEVLIEKDTYGILLQRYKELRKDNSGGGNGGEEIIFEIDPYLTEQDTGTIDYNYMNSRFEKWKKQLIQPNISPETLEATLEELHKSFAFLSQEEQKLANIFLNDVQSGDVSLQEGKTLSDYIAMYGANIKNNQVQSLHDYFGCEQKLVLDLLSANVSAENINEYGRFDALKNTVVKEQAQSYFAAVDGKKMPMFRVNNRVDQLLKNFILAGGIDLPKPES